MGLHLGMEVPGWPPENIDEWPSASKTTTERMGVANSDGKKTIRYMPFAIAIWGERRQPT